MVLIGFRKLYQTGIMIISVAYIFENLLYPCLSYFFLDNIIIEGVQSSVVDFHRYDPSSIRMIDSGCMHVKRYGGRPLGHVDFLWALRLPSLHIN